MLYQVWIWKSLTSEVADLFEVVDMADAQEAVLAVMHEHQLPYVPYAWVSPEDDGWDGEHLYHVDCPGVPFAGHSGG